MYLIGRQSQTDGAMRCPTDRGCRNQNRTDLVLQKRNKKHEAGGERVISPPGIGKMQEIRGGLQNETE